MFVFFFSSRRRHTRCGRDWSSDVCSSDLRGGGLCAARVSDGGARVSAARHPGADRARRTAARLPRRSEEHTSELQSRPHLVCRLLLEKKKKTQNTTRTTAVEMPNVKGKTRR